MDGENYQYTFNIKKKSFTAYNIMPNLYVVTQIHIDRIGSALETSFKVTTTLQV